MRITITTAAHMSDNTFAMICDAFRTRLGEATFDRVIDDGIIGGFIADVDGKIYDVSMASQLKKLKNEITG